MLNPERIDSKIIALVEALNRFEGIQTVWTRGGHSNPEIYRSREGEWCVPFQVARNVHGWFALEFLGGFVSDNYRDGSVSLRVVAHPPYLNIPGECLCFSLEGKDEDPTHVAAFLEEMREANYIAPSQEVVGPAGNLLRFPLDPADRPRECNTCRHHEPETETTFRCIVGGEGFTARSDMAAALGSNCWGWQKKST